MKKMKNNKITLYELKNDYICLALNYKIYYDNLNWYNFKKKREYKRLYESALKMINTVNNMIIVIK
jgi:hypothetical protein